jgi:hypothetical protein
MESIAKSAISIKIVDVLVDGAPFINGVARPIASKPLTNGDIG